MPLTLFGNYVENTAVAQNNNAYALGFVMNDRDDITTSAGFLNDIGYNFLLESRGSFPSETNKDEVVTLKLNYVIKF